MFYSEEFVLFPNNYRGKVLKILKECNVLYSYIDIGDVGAKCVVLLKWNVYGF